MDQGNELRKVLDRIQDVDRASKAARKKFGRFRPRRVDERLIYENHLAMQNLLRVAMSLDTSLHCARINRANVLACAEAQDMEGLSDHGKSLQANMKNLIGDRPR